MKHAHDCGASLAVHCGDPAHNAPGAQELMQLLTGNPYGIRTLGCLGNHEVDAVNAFGRRCEPRISSLHREALWNV